MSGKKAKLLRKITSYYPKFEKEYQYSVTKKKDSKKGQIYESITIINHPSSARAEYRKLKKEYKLGIITIS